MDASWQGYFKSFSPEEAAPCAEAGAKASTPAASAAVNVPTIIGAHELAEAIRELGHTAARLSPLEPPVAPAPALRPEAHSITAADLERLPATIVRGGPAGRGVRNAREAIDRLYAMYSGTAGYEFEHIIDPEARDWLRDAVESGRFHAPLSPERQKATLRRLSQVEGFEKYLHKAFSGQKRFSLEGTDTMVPILDTVIDEAAAAGARDVVIGMAHRGRLNVLTHVLEKPYAMIIAGFAGARHTHPLTEDDLTGDVKYHLGWHHTRQVEGHRVRVTLAPNPSHLAFVNPVVVGMTRAAQDNTGSAGPPEIDHKIALAIQVHGDAVFPGQGVVAETLNMPQIDGYRIGGSIHLIVNNQIGFTTLPEDGRSTRYASDLAKGFEIPVVHVNADDTQACLSLPRVDGRPDSPRYASGVEVSRWARQARGDGSSVPSSSWRRSAGWRSAGRRASA